MSPLFQQHGFFPHSVGRIGMGVLALIPMLMMVWNVAAAEVYTGEESVMSLINGQPISPMTWRESDPLILCELAEHFNPALHSLGVFQRDKTNMAALEAADAGVKHALDQFDRRRDELEPGVRSQVAMKLQGLWHELARARNIHRVKAWNEANLAAAASNPHLWVAPGLRADLSARQIVLAGEFVAQPSMDPIEFFVIDRRSGHDYEALVVSFALAGDVDRALKQLGLEPGSSVDQERLRFWPKGERVWLTLEWNSSYGERQKARIEEFIYDRRRGDALPLAGLVYTGSRWIEHAGESPMLAADIFEPYSIASAYNEPRSLLDVPWLANDSEVYGWQILAPERLLPAGTYVELIIEPERAAGEEPRIIELILNVTCVQGACKPVYELITADGERLVYGSAWYQLLAAFEHLTQAGRDPFVTVLVAREMPLGQVRWIFEQLAALEGYEGIRIEPPPEGQLFHRVFFMPDHLRDRERRGVQPWEVILHAPEEDPAVTLFRFIEHWKEDHLYPRIEVIAQGFSDYATAQTCLYKDPGSSLLLIEAPASLPYGALLDFLAPLTTHPTRYLTLSKPYQ